jgi:hypothetical protein
VVVSVGTFIVVLAVGTALIALWIDFRFPRLGPQGFLGAFIHLLAASIGAQLVVPLGLDTAGNKMVGVFVIALPALVYVFLTALWIMKVARGAMQGAYR